MIWSEDSPGQKRTRNCEGPDEFPVSMKMAAVESLCFPVVVQTRPQGSFDPVLALPVCKGQDFLEDDGPVVIISGRESIITVSDVSRDICVEPDQLSVVVSEEAVGPMNDFAGWG